MRSGFLAPKFYSGIWKVSSSISFLEQCILMGMGGIAALVVVCDAHCHLIEFLALKVEQNLIQNEKRFVYDMCHV